MKFADLFAGIGGFHYAIKAIDKNSKAVLVSEIDKFAKEAYSFNHDFNIDDIRNIRYFTENGDFGIEALNKIEDFDLLMGGFPCQTFSNAGKKLGFEDKTRGTLFFDIAKMIEIKKPKYILLENVKHLVSHDEGRTWETIKATLEELGYLVPLRPFELSPDKLGISMQIRQRVFIPGILKAGSGLDTFPEEEFLKLEDISSKPPKIIFDEVVEEKIVISDKKILLALEAWGEFVKNVKRPLGRTLPVIWLDHMNSKQPNMVGMADWEKKYIKDMKVIYESNKEFIDSWMSKYKVDAWQKRERKLEWQAGKDAFDIKDTFVQLRQSGFRFKKKNVFPTLVAMVQTSLFFDNKINSWRYLSKNEVRQLQSFPKTFKYNVPDYQSYKQFGNSVNVKVVQLVLEKLLKY